MQEQGERRHVGEHVHGLSVHQDLAPLLAVQARRVHPLEAGDAAERLGIDVHERLFREHRQRPILL